MIHFLPFIVIPVLIIAGLGYWRFGMTQQSLSTPSETIQQIQDSAPVEVPKTLPAITPTPVRNELSPQATAGETASSTSDPRVAVLETAVTDLKARIAILEKATPNTQTIGAKLATVYIPLGTGGTSGDKTWIENSNYGAIIDPAEYPGYSSMQLEVNFRMTQKSGTAYARLYNMTDSSAKEQVSTTSDSFSWQTSYGFTLPAGKKTYTLQTKSSEGAEIQLQSARIKVNF